jgi:hypothetical protein
MMRKNKSKKFKVNLRFKLIYHSFVCFLEREKVLYTQLEDLHQNYSTTKNPRLQKLQLDIEKDTNELNTIDPKNWTSSDRQRLTHYWLDLQRKFDEQHVDFIYKPNTSTSNHSYLGELHLKTANQDHEHLPIARLQRQQPISLFDPFENQDGMYRSHQVNKLSNLLLLVSLSLLDDQWT